MAGACSNMHCAFGLVTIAQNVCLKGRPLETAVSHLRCQLIDLRRFCGISLVTASSGNHSQKNMVTQRLSFEV